MSKPVHLQGRNGERGGVGGGDRGERNRGEEQGRGRRGTGDRREGEGRRETCHYLFLYTYIGSTTVLCFYSIS